MTFATIAIKEAPNTIDVSQDVKKVDMWLRSGDGIGRFKILLNNNDGQHNETFLTDDVVEILVENAVFMRGYVDIVQNIGSHEKDVYERYLEITGRDYGQDFINKWTEKIYYKQKADDMVQAALVDAGAEISYTSPSTATELPFTETPPTFLIDLIKKVAEQIHYEFYVDENKTLQFFLKGSKTSGILLTSDASNPQSNNILDIRRIEQDGFELRNYIFIRGPRVDDGWTEGNADGWESDSGPATISNEFVEVKKGASSIKFVRTDVLYPLKPRLEFPKYNYDFLDFRGIGTDQLVIWVKPLSDYTGRSYKFKVRLVNPAGGIEISYIFPTFVTHNKWMQINVPIGTECELFDDETDGRWYKALGSGWDWQVGAIIVEVYIDSVGNLDGGKDLNTLYVDGLSLPIIMRGIAQDGTSQGSYKTRKIPLPAANVASQIELDTLAMEELTRRKDPLQDQIVVTAKGEAGIISGVNKWLPGYQVYVKSRNNGVFSVLTFYGVIEEVHHVIDETPVKDGFAFVTEVVLSDKNAKISKQRKMFLHDPGIAFMKEFHDKLRYLEARNLRYGDWFPSLPKPLAVDHLADVIGIYSTEIPLRDRDGYAVGTETTTWTAWAEIITLKLYSRQDVKHVLAQLAFIGDISTFNPSKDDALHRGELRAFYSVDSGLNWTQFGSTVTVVESAARQEYTIDDNIITALNEPLWVKFEYRVRSDGSYVTWFYVDFPELRRRYFKGKRLDIS